MTLYKLTQSDGTPAHGGSGRWSLPKRNGEGWKPGAWREVKGKLVLCSHGLHCVRAKDILTWAADALWIVEWHGELVEDSDKAVVRRARLLRPVEAWNGKTIASLALDFAERAQLHAAEALPRWRDVYPEDGRPAAAIDAAAAAVAAGRRFLLGEIDESAARSAARSAWSAWSAARSATRSAAWSAASARSAAEREWQVARIITVLGLPEPVAVK